MKSAKIFEVFNAALHRLDFKWCQAKQVFQGTFEALSLSLSSAVLKCEQTTHLKRFQDQRSRTLSPLKWQNASGNLLVRVVSSFMEKIDTLVCSPTSNSGKYR